MVPVPTHRVPVTAQVEPAPVTLADGVPGKIASISAPSRLVSLPPPLMVSWPAPKMPMPVWPLTVSAEGR